MHLREKGIFLQNILYLHPPHLHPGGGPVRLQLVEVVGEGEEDAGLRHPDLQQVQAVRHGLDTVLNQGVCACIYFILEAN